MSKVCMECLGNSNYDYPKDIYVCEKCGKQNTAQDFEKQDVKKINILGTEYKIIYVTAAEDAELENINGCVDPTTKIIKLRKYEPAEKRINNVENFDELLNGTIRHEIVHSFLYESGLRDYYLDETIVEWIALQFPKLLKVFNETDAL